MNHQNIFCSSGRKCYCCGKGGQKSPQCFHKNRPKEEWSINKAKSEELSLSQIGNTSTHSTASTPTTDTNSIKNNNENKGTKGSAGWVGEHFNLLQIDETKNGSCCTINPHQ